jgi:4-amino-4-deoxy-L-arabinose transferase-like glycosyltransferase
MLDAWLETARRRWELLALLAIAALAAWLRLRRLDLVEFKVDEAIAIDMARGVLNGDFPTAGLTSSTGARNPPLLIYLTAIPLAVRDDPLAATAFVGLLAVVAVVLTYFVLRPRFGSLVALGAAALFATAPWAVLFGRKVWGQNVLPIVSVGLLWSLFAVLERQRTRAIAFVPVSVCLAFQLNFSAIALAIPAAAVLLYRARDVHWKALAVGVGVALLLIEPWFLHQTTHGFADISALVSRESDEEAATSESGPVDAFRMSFRLVGVGDWEYVAGDSLTPYARDAEPVWTLTRAAGVVAAALFVLGLVTSIVCVVRNARVTRRRPWLELDAAVARRALLLVWLAGVCLVYAAPASDRLYPHYLIVSYPVSFVVLALGLADLTAAVRGRPGRGAWLGAAATIVVVCVAFTAFTLSFQSYVGREGGTTGDYGVVYRDKLELADFVRVRGLRIRDDLPIDFLVTGDRDLPPGNPPFVTVVDRLLHPAQPCVGELRSFGALDACIPARR